MPDRADIPGLEELRDLFEAQLPSVSTEHALKGLHDAFLGRKSGQIPGLMKTLGSLPPDERRDFGRVDHEIKWGVRSVDGGRKCQRSTVPLPHAAFRTSPYSTVWICSRNRYKALFISTTCREISASFAFAPQPQPKLTNVTESSANQSWQTRSFPKTSRAVPLITITYFPGTRLTDTRSMTGGLTALSPTVSVAASFSMTASGPHLPKMV